MAWTASANWGGPVHPKANFAPRYRLVVQLRSAQPRHRPPQQRRGAIWRPFRLVPISAAGGRVPFRWFAGSVWRSPVSQSDPISSCGERFALEYLLFSSLVSDHLASAGFGAPAAPLGATGTGPLLIVDQNRENTLAKLAGVDPRAILFRDPRAEDQLFTRWYRCGH